MTTLNGDTREFDVEEIPIEDKVVLLVAGPNSQLSILVKCLAQLPHKGRFSSH
jgi:hypothetical protein